MHRLFLRFARQYKEFTMGTETMIEQWLIEGDGGIIA